jgi:hypothetical protein
MLISLIRDRREAAHTRPYLLFVGAGASQSSGASLFDPIIRAVGCTTYEEFSRRMEGRSSEERYTILRPHIEGLHPSPAALQLAKLIREGFFSTILTTNFDNLLEVALNAVGVSPEQYVVHVHTAERPLKDLATRLRRKSPRIKIVKLHGDLKEHEFALTDTETLQYTKEVEEQLRQTFASDDVIILGSRFADANLQRVIDSKGSSIWYVNPTPATGTFAVTLRSRGSHENQITGDDGTFDSFVGALHASLLGPDEPSPIRLQWTCFHPFIVGCPPPPSAGTALEHGRRCTFVDDTAVDWFDFGVACAWRRSDVLYPSISEFAQQRRDLYKQILDGPGVPSITAAMNEVRAKAEWNLPDVLRTPLPAKEYALSVVRLSEPAAHPKLAAMLQLLSCPSILVDAYRGPDDVAAGDASAEAERKYLQTGIEADLEEFKYVDRLRGCAAWSGVAFLTSQDALATAILDFEAELQALWWLLELLLHARAIDPTIAGFVEQHVHPILNRTLATGSRDATPLTLAREAIIKTSRIENQWRMAHD